jgi:hypothetical protein
MPSATRTRNCLAHSRPCTSLSHTSPQPDWKNSTIASSRYTTTRAGSVRLRRSRTPAPPTTRSTSPGGNTFASTPIPIRSGSRSPATTCCPGPATQAILHRRNLNLTPLPQGLAGLLSRIRAFSALAAYLAGR